MTKEFTKFPNRRIMDLSMDPIMANMLSTVYDDKWKRLRAIVSPTFSTGKLRRMRPLIDECLQNLIANTNKLMKESDKQEVDMKKVLSAFTMEVVIRVAFGTKVDAMLDDNHPIIANAKQLFSKDFSFLSLPKAVILVFMPRLARFLGLNFMPKKMTQFFLELVRSIIAERQKDKETKRYDFLQLLLDANQNQNQLDGENIDFGGQKFKALSDMEMMSQCVLFFLAGYETTATTLSFATYFMAKHPECQQILYEDSVKLFESDVSLDYDAIERLEYVNAFLSESLRLYPPGFQIERTCSEDVVLGREEIKISKGDIMSFPIFALHRDPSQYEEPNCFNPDRFLPGNVSHHPYAYLPFGAGPRNCVAKRLALMEAKLAILYLVYNFKFSFSDNTDDPPVFFKNSGILSPKRILVKVEQRKTNDS